MLPEALDTNPN
ncbi:mRNA-capping enzyme, putative [Schistosoma mansoni]|nr:mRNA-capping enzyme, putative [Schistosoma mansoni]|eukprot:XP_018645741.1 mRNA-capping enzyme, putative [Schistosoma mansoni]